MCELTWSKSRCKGVITVGKGTYNNKPVLWNIRKSPAKVAYQLYLGDEKSKLSVTTQATLEGCKEYAEGYL